MKNELTCEIVEDLLPSYVEELTNDVTNEAVRVHMETCETCREKLETIKEPVLQEETVEEKEIDYLKKTRRGYHKKAIIGVAITAMALLLFFLVRTSVVSTGVEDSSLIDCTIKVDETEKFVYFCGNLVDSSKGIADVSYEMEDGVLEISVRQTWTPIFYKNAVAEHYYYEGELTQVRVENRIVWDHGKEILPEVANIYDTKHLYIGDPSANGNSLRALGVQKKLGDYTMELYTTEEPYGMALFLDENYSKESVEKLEKWMKSYASAMIALIDNMNYMNFSYQVEGKECTFTFTEQQADELAGQSVKAMADNGADFQKLMDILDLVQEVALYQQ